MGCDTLVALPPATRDRVTLFAKNSDRPPRECQRLMQVPRRSHPADAQVRCQYVEIPQVRETAAMLGSQPYWLWGFEHGVNEHRVAVGNETVFAREPLGPTGLVGMDLVRLALERARNADQALETITTLIEAHGQGGSGHVHVEWPYHNAFLVADPGAAWTLETSGRHWAACRVAEIGNASNGLALASDWERGSTDLTAFAVTQGWWPAAGGRVDFAAAYADATGVPPNLCAERRRRAATLLAESHGQLTPAALRAVLRDHYESGTVHRARPFDDPRFFELCMHADPLDNTTAAMVASLPPDPAAVGAVWVCLGSPCTGAFLPCYLEGTVPPRLAKGGADTDPASPWWRMRELLTLVERDFARYTPIVRARWDAFEASVAAEATGIEADALSRPRPEAARLLTAFMEHTVDRWLDETETLIHELAS